MHDIESAAVAGNQMGITPLRRLQIYLPEGYSTTRRSYPVLYWIPGWETPANREYVGGLDSAISKGWMPPAIVVFVDVREGLVLLNSPVFGQWEDFVVDELVPFVDAEYRTIPQPDGRAIMGHSTGGYGAVMLALRHPGVWSAVGLNEASVWAGCSLPLGTLPTEFGEYASLSGYVRAWLQVAIAIAYDPSSPLLFRMPSTDPDGALTDATWAPYCMLNSATVQTHADTLQELAAFEVVVANHGSTNRAENHTMWRAMQEAGASGSLMEMPGTHGGGRATRFINLARRILPELHTGYPDARARTAAWADLKAARDHGAR
jgi:pimeloyl-ACP methyl ester carboxylesterase